MALHFSLCLNNQIIGEFQAVRIKGDAHQDSINTYKVKLDERSFEIEHRYGDGAWVLVRKSIEQYEAFNVGCIAWSPLIEVLLARGELKSQGD